MGRRYPILLALALLGVATWLPSRPTLGLVILNGPPVIEAGVRRTTPIQLPDCPIGAIQTIAGGAVGDGGPATAATLHTPSSVALGPDGSIYIADYAGGRVRKVDTAGRIASVAGNDERAYGGEGGRADVVSLDYPRGVAVAADGSLYVAEHGAHRIRRIDTGGVITTVAGNGDASYQGDGGRADRTSLNYPAGVAVAPDGSIYIADRENHAVRKVDPAGTITTVAGGPFRGRLTTASSSIRVAAPKGLGDGGRATAAALERPYAVAVGPDGSLYIADAGHNRIRRLDPAGIISTIAGGGHPEDGLGDGGPATEARLDHPEGIAVAPDGTIYVADTYNNRIRRIDHEGIITSVAGSGRKGASGGGYAGDGGRAVDALLRYPEGVAVDGDGKLYIADTLNHRVRVVDAAGIITTVAGGALGDGGPAEKASIYKQLGIAVGPDGSVYFAEWDDNRVRRIGPDGVIATVAGNGLPGFSGDGGAATEARLFHPKGVAIGPDGSLYIADYGNNRIRKVGPDGIITTVAGSGDHNYSGDGGPATQAALRYPGAVAVGRDGALYIADRENHRVRKVDPHGVITTVAGTGKSGYSGDGGPAVEAKVGRPCAVTPGPDGSLYIADGSNFRIRRVDPAGVITTVGGTGAGGFAGDGYPAAEARLNWYEVHSLAVGPDGTLYIPDQCNHRIRTVNPGGIIHTIAGTGRRDPCGDGGRATEAGLCYPNGVALGGDGTLYIADEGNRRIRRIRWWPCEPDRAKQLADRLRAKADDSPSAWREVTELYIIAGTWEEATSAAEASLELTPEEDESAYMRAQLVLARAYLGKRDDHGARRLLIRVLARARETSVLREAGDALVNLYLLRGERDQAIATLNDLRMRTHDETLHRWVQERLSAIADG